MKLIEYPFSSLFEHGVFLDCTWKDLGVDDKEWPAAAVGMFAYVTHGFDTLELDRLIPIGAEYLEYLKWQSVQEWIKENRCAVCIDEKQASEIEVLHVLMDREQEQIEELLGWEKYDAYVNESIKRVFRSETLDQFRVPCKPDTMKVLVECGGQRQISAKAQIVDCEEKTFRGKLLDMLDDDVEVYENDELEIRIESAGGDGQPVLVGTKIVQDKPFYDRSITPEERAAFELWTNGLGSSAKRFNGEDPMPPKRKKATKDSWNRRDMPSRHEDFYLGLEITTVEKEVLEYGHIPMAMEDHWFMYYEDDIVHYHRSWTGYCMYEAKVEPYEDHYIVSDCRVNRYPGHNRGTDVEYDKYWLARLILWEVGR